MGEMKNFGPKPAYKPDEFFLIFDFRIYYHVWSKLLQDGNSKFRRFLYSNQNWPLKSIYWPQNALFGITRSCPTKFSIKARRLQPLQTIIMKGTWCIFKISRFEKGTGNEAIGSSRPLRKIFFHFFWVSIRHCLP